MECVYEVFISLFLFCFLKKKKSSEGDDSFTRRRVVLVICEAECYQKRRLPAQSTSFTKILVFNSRSRVCQISTTTSHRCLSRVMTLGMYVCAVPVYCKPHGHVHRVTLTHNGGRFQNQLLGETRDKIIWPINTPVCIHWVCSFNNYLQWIKHFGGHSP